MTALYIMMFHLNTVTQYKVQSHCTFYLVTWVINKHGSTLPLMNQRILTLPGEVTYFVTLVANAMHVNPTVPMAMKIKL